MATAPRRKKRVAEVSAFADDFVATREVWSEHMAVIVPNAMEVAADVGNMAVDIANSPLGQRAKRNPEISFAIAALTLGLLSRLFRR